MYVSHYDMLHNRVCSSHTEEVGVQERSEIANEPAPGEGDGASRQPDNDSCTAERGNDRMEERGNIGMTELQIGSVTDSEPDGMPARNNDGLTNRQNDDVVNHEKFGIKNGGMTEMENSCTLQQLKKQMHCYQHKMREMEEEVSTHSLPPLLSPPLPSPLLSSHIYTLSLSSTLDRSTVQ